VQIRIGRIFERLLDDPLKSFEVDIHQEPAHPAPATLQDVEHHPTRNDSGSTRHADSLANAAQSGQN